MTDTLGLDTHVRECTLETLSGVRLLWGETRARPGAAASAEAGRVGAGRWVTRLASTRVAGALDDARGRPPARPAAEADCGGAAPAPVRRAPAPSRARAACAHEWGRVDAPRAARARGLRARWSRRGAPVASGLQRGPPSCHPSGPFCSCWAALDGDQVAGWVKRVQERRAATVGRAGGASECMFTRLAFREYAGHGSAAERAQQVI